MASISPSLVRQEHGEAFGPYKCVACKSRFMTTTEYLGKVPRCIFHRAKTCGECSVCYKEDRGIIRLSCGHTGCFDCTYKWFKRCFEERQCASCPMCRKPMPQLEMNTSNPRWIRG